LRAIETPGHARDHLCFYLEEERAVFTGDVVLGAGTTVIPRDGDLGDYLDSLNRLLALDIDVLFPAHGPLIREPHAKIREYLDHRALRERQIVDGVVAGISEVQALVRRIYVDIPESLYPAAGVSVEAHLRKLEKEGVVLRDGERWIPA
jgi:ribonuclease/clavin/mitogillin